MLCFLVTTVFRFALLPYYQRITLINFLPSKIRTGDIPESNETIFIFYDVILCFSNQKLKNLQVINMTETIKD